MEMHLQPLATTCSVSGEAFTEGARVASFLVRSGATMEIVRYDVLETHAKGFTPEGVVACRWVHAYKPRKHGENPDRALKLTAENLFVALADPTTEPTPENTRLVQFLGLMLERKKILRPKGRTADGARNRFEHAKSKHIFEIPADELTPEFFVAVQQQLSVLVGAPKTPPAAPDAPPAETAAARAAAAQESAPPAVAPESPEAGAAPPNNSGTPAPSDDSGPGAKDDRPEEPGPTEAAGSATNEPTATESAMESTEPARVLDAANQDPEETRSPEANRSPASRSDGGSAAA